VDLRIIIIMLIALGLFGLLVLPKVMVSKKKTRLMNEPAPTAHAPSAQRILSGDRTVLYFYSPTCKVCATQEPAVEKVRKKYPKAVFKIDAKQDGKSLSAYGVMRVPFLAFIEGGKVVYAQTAVLSADTITAFLAAGGLP
jgi:thiol-disulfide isomerase/thioredoxin